MAFGKIGSFSVLNTLGSGAHSSILHIRREADGREYALKVVPIEDPSDKKYLDQAEHEFRVGQMLNHPNLVKVYTLELEKGLFGLGAVKKAKLLIEFVNGETLDNVKLMKQAKLLRVLEKVAGGLAHMHSKDVIHGDVKPNNIMLGRGLNVKIIDYGLATIKGEGKGRIQGTAEYMAPETAEHKLISERSDIFNFGVTMYRLTTFKMPPSIFSDMPGTLVSEKKYLAALKPVYDLNPIASRHFADLIHRCMSYKATMRPESMKLVQETLARLADEAEAKLDDPAELED
jgi:serine/threonine protein kinase